VKPNGDIINRMHCPYLPSSSNPIPVRQIEVVTSISRAKAFKDWPEWAVAISLLKSPEDRGVGDTVRRTIGEPISNKFKSWYASIFKKQCGCNARQNKWNQEYPYV
jgi:hypothetical protein